MSPTTPTLVDDIGNQPYTFKYKTSNKTSIEPNKAAGNTFGETCSTTTKNHEKHHRNK